MGSRYAQFACLLFAFAVASAPNAAGPRTFDAHEDLPDGRFWQRIDTYHSKLDHRNWAYSNRFASASSGHLTVVDTLVSGDGGLEIGGSADPNPMLVNIERTSIAGNSIGVGISGNTVGVISDSTIAGGILGLRLDGNGSQSLTLYGNRITHNTKGVLATSGAEVRTAGNNVLDRNGTNIDTTGGGIVTPIAAF